VDLEMWVRAQMWEPKYRPLKKVSKEDASRHARGELGIAGKAAQE
jgi:malate dehydrogenase (oxaloacetate-decarboxylating)